MYDCHGPWEAKQDSIEAFAEKESNPNGHTNPVYAAMLKTMDDNFGRVMSAIEELCISDNTIVIFFSDNGGNTHSMEEVEQKRNLANPKHRAHRDTKIYNKYAGIQHPTKNLGLRAGKGRLYEDGARVPLMMRWPEQIPEGTTSEAIVNNIDLHATLLELTGQPKPDGHIIDGVSFASVLTKGDDGAGRTSVSFFSYHNAGISVRDGDWKLIRRFVRKPDEYEGLAELFNLNDDLGETNNLAATMPEKVAELDKLIDAHFRKTGGLTPESNPTYREPAPKTVTPQSAIHRFVPRQCQIDQIEGCIRVVSEGKMPFLGTAQVKLTGPILLHLRARLSGDGSGQGRVQWRTNLQDEFPQSSQVIDFDMNDASEWQDIKLQVPVDGRSQLIRIHLPAGKVTEIQSIRWEAKKQTPVEWDFLDSSDLQ